MLGAALSPAFQIDNSLLWLVTFWERLERVFFVVVKLYSIPPNLIN